MNTKDLAILIKQLGLKDIASLDTMTVPELKDLALKLRALSQKTFLDYVPQDKQRLFHLSTAPIKLILGGNRSGKTISSFHDVMWQLTGEYPSWYPEDMKLMTPVYTRWIATDFKQGVGGVFQPYFDQLVPKNYIKRILKTQQGIIQKVFFANGSILEILTNEQDLDVFEGWHGNRVHIDEPCSRERYIASKRGLIDYGGKVSFSLTPLSEPWIYDELYENADGTRIFEVTIETRDNAYLSKEEIDEFENALTDDEKEARLHGRFTHLTGVVYKEFNREVNIVSDHDIPQHWRIIHIIDPHDRKPHVNIWAAIDESNNIFVYDELEANGTIPEISKLIKTHEYHRQADLRIIDPNKARSPAKIGAKGSVASEFTKEGLRFYTNINNDLTAGHLAVKKALMYNKAKPLGLGNRPRLYIFRSCKKTIKGMTHYTWDDYKNPHEKSPKEKPKDLFKDFPDCIRYLIMANPQYEAPEIRTDKPKFRSITGW